MYIDNRTSITGKLHPAVDATKRKNPPSVIKVALATPSPSRVMFEAGGATTTWSIAETYSARTKTF